MVGGGAGVVVVVVVVVVMMCRRSILSTMIAKVLPVGVDTTVAAVIVAVANVGGGGLLLRVVSVGCIDVTMVSFVGASGGGASCDVVIVGRSHHYFRYPVQVRGHLAWHERHQGYLEEKRRLAKEWRRGRTQLEHEQAVSGAQRILEGLWSN